MPAPAPGRQRQAARRSAAGSHRVCCRGRRPAKPGPTHRLQCLLALPPAHLECHTCTSLRRTAGGCVSALLCGGGHCRAAELGRGGWQGCLLSSQRLLLGRAHGSGPAIAAGAGHAGASGRNGSISLLALKLGLDGGLGAASGAGGSGDGAGWRRRFLGCRDEHRRQQNEQTGVAHVGARSSSSIGISPQAELLYTLKKKNCLGRRAPCGGSYPHLHAGCSPCLVSCFNSQAP